MALNEVVPRYTQFIEAKTVEQNVNAILESLTSLPKINRHSIDLFDYMVKWMDIHDPL